MFSTILLLLLGLQTFYPLAIYSVYYGNKGYIAAVLCENKARPQLHCNGKCFLKKQLKKAEEERHKEQSGNKETEGLLYVAPPLITTPRQPEVAAIASPAMHTESYSYLFAAFLLRPPGNIIYTC